MNGKKDPILIYKERLIGLQSCAKVMRLPGQTPEETASGAIALFDLLEADAMRAAGLTRQAPPHKESDAVGHQAAVEKFVSDNNLNRAQFEKWIGGSFCPEVKAGGLCAISADHAAQILARPTECLKAFGEATAPKTPGGETLGGQAAA